MKGNKKNITEKINDALKAMLSKLEIKDLLICISENLSKIADFDSVIIILKEEDTSLISSKIKSNPVKYIDKIKTKNNASIFNVSEADDIKIIKLHNLEGLNKLLIIKHLFYNGEFVCTIKMVLSNDRLDINDDFMQLINVYFEQSILALNNAKSYKLIKEHAMYDELTKIYNRRYLMKLATEELAHETAFTVAMLDIDFFKKINDTYGHLFGDKVIQFIADICKKSMPTGSIVGRYGGEEFLIFLKGIKLDIAFILLDKLRREIEALTFKHNTNEKVKVTISIGFSYKQNINDDLNMLINYADNALYTAKHAGRNCVKSYSK